MNLNNIVEKSEKTEIYLNLVNVIIVALDNYGKITFLNKKGYDILGWNEGELLGKSWFENCVPLNDRERVYDYFKKLMSGETDIIPIYENHVLTKSSEEKLITWSTDIPRDSEGNITGAVSSGEDITESKKAEQKLKDSEEKYRLLFTNMNAGFALHEVIVDDNNKPVDYKYLEVNPGFEKLTGMKKEDLIGKTVTEAIPGTEDDPADWIGKFGNVGLTGIPLTVEDYSEAFNRWYNVSGYSPKKGYFAVTFTDITEHKKAEQQLKDSEEKYRNAYNRSNLYKDVFTHDINNILQNILSSLELTKIFSSDPKKRQSFEGSYKSYL